MFGRDRSFAVSAGLRVVTNGLMWLLKCQRLPIPGLTHKIWFISTLGH